jgi:hypothetical protein
MEWRMAPHVRLNTFYDVFIFPWLTYQCDEPSSGYETGLQLVFQLSHQAELLMRFKQKMTEKNDEPLVEKHPSIVAVMKNQYRMQYTDKTTHWVFQTVFDFNTFENELTDIVTQGVAVSQTIRFTTFQNKLDLSVRFSLFDASHYENRLFSYEKSLPGSFSMPLLYGQGARMGFCLTYNVTKRLSWWLKAGLYSYQDRSQTGTNEERAEGNDLTDVQCLIRWKF